MRESLPINEQEPNRERRETPFPIFAINEIRQGSPAEMAGLKVGDLIVDYDGIPAKDMREYIAYQQSRKGSPIALTIMALTPYGAQSRETRILEPELSQASNTYVAGFVMSESQMAPVANETMQDGERAYMRTSGSFFDEQGEAIGRFQYDIDMVPTAVKSADPETDGPPQSHEGYRLRSFIVKSLDESQQVDIASSYNPKNVSIYVVPTAHGHGGGIAQHSDVQIGPIFGRAADAHVVLHELGHMRQDEDPKLKGIHDYYGYDKAWRLPSVEGLLGIIKSAKAFGIELDTERVRALTPEFKRVKDLAQHEVSEKSDEWQALQERRIRKEISKDEFEEAVEHFNLELDGREARHYSSLKSMEIADGITIHDVLALPRRIIERDAEARALKSEREIRSSIGVDLTKKDFLGRRTIEAVDSYMNEIGATTKKMQAYREIDIENQDASSAV